MVYGLGSLTPGSVACMRAGGAFGRGFGGPANAVESAERESIPSRRKAEAPTPRRRALHKVPWP